METSGPARLSEVEAKQRIVLQVARNLADSGEIALGDKADDMYV
jgi:flagellar motor switch protein FliG